MQISVVADIHGNIEALARVAERADQLVILGDLLDYIDYHDPTRGIVSEMFGTDAAIRFASLRKAGEFLALRQYNAQLWESITDAAGTISGIIQQRYQQILDILPPHTIVTLGNVDVAADWQAVAGQHMAYRDGESILIDGLRFGFIAGGCRRVPPAGIASPSAKSQPRSAWRPFMRSAPEYRTVLDRIGRTDVICTHIPPHHPLLRYDIVPGRLEMFAPGLTEYLERFRPQMSLFGHVHQPLASQARIGMTHCVNVGHFQRYGKPFVIDSDMLHDARSAR